MKTEVMKSKGLEGKQKKFSPLKFILGLFMVSIGLILFLSACWIIILGLYPAFIGTSLLFQSFGFDVFNLMWKNMAPQQ